MGDDLADLGDAGPLGPGGLPVGRGGARWSTAATTSALAAGGRGAVREVIELILKRQGLWDPSRSAGRTGRAA